jgi:hypothetical protein
MPIFFFHVRDSAPLFKDYGGTDFPNLAMAVNEAHCIAAEIVGGLLGRPILFANLQVNICDASGKILEIVDMPDTAGFPR